MRMAAMLLLMLLAGCGVSSSLQERGVEAGQVRLLQDECGNRYMVKFGYGEHAAISAVGNTVLCDPGRTK